MIASRLKKRGMSWSKKGTIQPSKNKRDYLKYIKLSKFIK